MSARVFCTGDFDKFAQKQRITDEVLARAAEEIEAGLVEANLGGNVFKKRIARAGEGKASGYRVLVAFRVESMVVFLYGFAKNDRANVNATELRALRAIAAVTLNLTELELETALGVKIVREIVRRDEDE